MLLIASMALSMAACLLASSGIGLAAVMVNLGAVVYLQDALNRVWTQVGSRHSAPPRRRWLRLTRGRSGASHPGRSHRGRPGRVSGEPLQRAGGLVRPATIG